MRNRRPASAGIQTSLQFRAYTDGTHDGASLTPGSRRARHQLVNVHWNAWVARNGYRAKNWEDYHRTARHYLEGYFQRAGADLGDVLLWPVTRSAAAIVTAMNEERTLPAIIEQLDRLPFSQKIIVVNGSSDRTLDIARSCRDAQVVYYPEPLGHDVGRAIGAKLADADILFFLDGDIVIDAEDMIPFVHAIDQGYDVALNDITPYVGRFDRRDAVTILKEFLNRSLNREDLKLSSLTAVPHAISRRAVETVGAAKLAVPPLAQALAVKHGLRVGMAGSIDVIAQNRKREGNVGDVNPVSRMIIGDHLEAMQYLLEREGSRLRFPDWIRDRRLAGGS
jgi:hypothetical protein